jgi:hypothetical protein
METVVPEDLTVLSDEELATLATALEAEFDALYDAGSTDLATLTAIADAIEQARTETVAREERAIQTAQAIAQLAERIHPVAEETVEVEASAEEPEETDEVAEEAEPTADADEVEANTEERELVTASAPNPKALSARAVKARTHTPEAPKAGPEVVITAAADIPGVAGGANLDTMALANALHAKARTLSNGSGMIPVASINLPIPAENKVGVDMAYNMEVIERVTAPEALTASGWCAPSQTLYDLFGIDAGDGLLDLPTVQVTRGGLKVPGFLGYGDAADGLWTWTEEDNDNAHSAEPTASKPCLYIPCPDFNDYRLVAEGLCITAGNLTDRAFPELTRRFVALAINSHLHRLSAAMIADISGSATGVTMGAVDTSAAGSILNAIDLQVEDYRSQYRMSVSAILEAVFPLWTKALIRADLAMRHGVMLTNVTDEMVDEHFRARKVRAQFVHDYQPLYSVAAKTTWPTSLDFLLYPAGGYIKGDGGVIDLGVVRDSVLNATNDYTAAWTEQLYLVAQLGPNAREVTINYAVDGVTACCPTPAS